jgi:hypothetical protein
MVNEIGQPYAYTGDDPVNGVDPLGLFWGEGTLDKWRHDVASNVDANWNGIKSFATGLVGTPSGCKTNEAAYDAGNITWWADAIGGLFGDDGVNDGDDGNVAPESQESTSAQLSSLASKAQATVGTGSGPVYGTAVHSAFAAEISTLGDSNLSTEISYLNGRVVPYGTAGSVRLDVVEGGDMTPTAVYDLKTGTATLTPDRIAQIQANLPAGYQNVPVIEIRP